MKTRITITIDPKLLAQLQEKAEKERRSVSSMIEFIIAKDLKKSLSKQERNI